MNKKKNFQHAAAIINIVLAGLAAFVFFMSLFMINQVVDLLAQQQGVTLSSEELALLKSTTTAVIVVYMLFNVALLIISIFAEVKTVKGEKAKGLFITMIVLNSIAFLVMLFSNILIALVAAVPLAFSIVVLCLKDPETVTMESPLESNNINE